ncbi:hypothetical protein TB2_000066 [Malus domestica]
MESIFRFEAFWCKEEGFRETIARCWSVEGDGGGMYVWKTKLHSTRRGIFRWNADKFRGRKIEIQKLNSHLGHLTQNWEVNSREIGEVMETLNHLEAQEEAYWAARSRIRWLQADDSNTTFFHQSTVLRPCRNKLSRIRNEEGIWEDNPVEDG